MNLREITSNLLAVIALRSFDAEFTFLATDLGQQYIKQSQFRVYLFPILLAQMNRNVSYLHLGDGVPGIWISDSLG